MRIAMMARNRWSRAPIPLAWGDGLVVVPDPSEAHSSARTGPGRPVPGPVSRCIATLLPATGPAALLHPPSLLVGKPGPMLAATACGWRFGWRLDPLHLDLFRIGRPRVVVHSLWVAAEQRAFRRVEILPGAAATYPHPVRLAELGSR